MMFLTEKASYTCAAVSTGRQWHHYVGQANPLSLYCRPMTTAERSKTGRLYSDLKAKHALFVAARRGV